MEKLYYLNHQQYQTGDVKTAFKFAKELCKQYSKIDTITLLVPSVQQYDIITKELGITKQNCTEHIVPGKLKKHLQVHTIRTYHPDRHLAGNEEYELLISIFIKPKNLEQFVAEPKVKYWIIVPWLYEENRSFLEVHKAIDMTTGVAIHVDYDLDKRVTNAIKWLKTTSSSDFNFSHHDDKERLKQMSNALSHYGVSLTYDAVVSCCINHGIPYVAALMIAEYFTNAQHHRYPIHNHEYDYTFMKQVMEREDWV